jgi:hypothetical protein
MAIEFPHLNNIVELYLGSNSLKNLREIRNLKPLFRMIILDLSGNPICKDEKYRHYVIFHNKKLKVLDGIPIEPNERIAASEIFEGRLTEEMLEH